MVAFVNPLSNIQAGQQWVNGLFQQQAQNRAGRSLATGDYGGASRALLNSGDVGGGLALQHQGQQQQDRQRAESDRAKAEQLAATLQITRALRTVRDQGGDVATELPKYRSAFIAMGTDPAQLSQIESQIAANPAFLDQVEQITGQQLQELSFQKSGDELLVFAPGNPDPVRRFAPTPDPIVNNNVIRDPVTFEVIADDRDPEYIQRDPTKQLLDVSPAAGGVTSGVRTNPDAILEGVLEREGGLVESDGRSGAPANFGINQRANPDVDVRNLTREGAKAIYQERYINPILQAGVSGPILEAVVDFGVNAGVNRSLDFWRRSGGDINEFNRLRLAHYRSLPDYDQNGRSWERRVRETTPGSTGSVSTGGGPRVVSEAQAPASGSGILSPEEQAALGLPPAGRYQRNSAGAISLIEGTAQGGRNGQFDATTRGALQAARDAASSARARAADAQRFVELNKDRATGPGARLAGPLLSADPTYAEMRAIGSRLVPGEREPGSGAMSDRDVNLYREAVIGLSNPGPTNQALARVITAQAERDAEYAAFLDEYATRNGNLNGATEDWTAYVNANPLFERRGGNTAVRPRVQSWRQFMGYGERERGGRGGSGAQPSQSGRASSPVPGIPAALWQSSSPQQRQYWQRTPPSGERGSRTNPLRLNPADPGVGFARVPRGGYFLHPDGTVRRKP